MKIELKNNSARIIPGESINLSNAEEFKDKFLELVEEKNIKKIIIDFKNVEKIDSSGLGKLLLFNKITEENEGSLRIENINSQYVRNVFNMVDLKDTMDLDL